MKPVQSNCGTLVINEPTRVQARQHTPTAPLIPPKLSDIEESSFPGGTTLNFDPNMLLPPNTLEVLVNCRLAELAEEQKHNHQPQVESCGCSDSGPLIPPTPNWN